MRGGDSSREQSVPNLGFLLAERSGFRGNKGRAQDVHGDRGQAGQATDQAGDPPGPQSQGVDSSRGASSLRSISASLKFRVARSFNSRDNGANSSGLNKWIRSTFPFPRTPLSNSLLLPTLRLPSGVLVALSIDRRACGSGRYAAYPVPCPSPRGPGRVSPCGFGRRSVGGRAWG